MPIEKSAASLPLAARRALRLGLAAALALAVSYGLALPLPFLAPLFVFMLSANPGPPPAAKGLVGLTLVVILTLGVGLLVIPVLLHYPAAGFLLVALGLFLSAYVSVILGKAPVGALLAVGFTLIPAAGTVSSALATAVIGALVCAIAVAVVCQWLVYPWLPEDANVPVTAADTANVRDVAAPWVAIRSVLVVLPPFFLLLVDPTRYMPIIMKTILLGQQASEVDTRAAGRELLGSTLLAGGFAVLFWFALKLWPSLWMFFLWMLLFGLYFGAKLYGALRSRYPPSFWQNVAVTMIILLGPAVQDSSNGKDVYEAFAVRMGLFVAVALYTWGAVHVLERLRQHRAGRLQPLRGSS